MSGSESDHVSGRQGADFAIGLAKQLRCEIGEVTPPHGPGMIPSCLDVIVADTIGLEQCAELPIACKQEVALAARDPEEPQIAVHRFGIGQADSDRVRRRRCRAERANPTELVVMIHATVSA